jgi:hypothetical protein
MTHPVLLPSISRDCRLSWLALRLQSGSSQVQQFGRFLLPKSKKNSSGSRSVLNSDPGSGGLENCHGLSFMKGSVIDFVC